MPELSVSKAKKPSLPAREKKKPLVSALKLKTPFGDSWEKRKKRDAPPPVLCRDRLLTRPSNSNLKPSSQVSGPAKEPATTSTENQKPTRAVPSSPKAPKSHRHRPAPNRGKSMGEENAPRFMSMAQARDVQAAHNRPRPKRAKPRKIPRRESVLGIPSTSTAAPKKGTLSRASKKESTSQSRHKRVMKEINDRQLKYDPQCKDTLRRVMKLKLVKRINACLNAMRLDLQKKGQAVECKPLYRLKEIRRASVLLGLPKAGSRLSAASIGHMIMGDCRRYSNLSCFNEGAPASAGACLGPATPRTLTAATVNDANRSTRASLLDQDWLAYWQSSRNSLISEVGEFEPTDVFPPATLPYAHVLPLFSRSPNTLRSSSPSLSTLYDSYLSDEPSPAFSEVTIRASNSTFIDEMSPSGDPPGQGPSPGHLVTASDEKSQSLGDKHHSSQKGTANQAANYESPASLSDRPGGPDSGSPRSFGQNQQVDAQIESVPQRTKEQISSEPQPSPKDTHNTRIPRGPALKQVQGLGTSSQKGSRSTSDLRSSIPVAVRRRSAEQLGISTQMKHTEASSSEARVVDKPRGPRPRPAAEQIAFPMPIPVQETEGSAKADSSSSSSSVSSWDFGEENEPERPPQTVYTGEYRTRVLTIPGYGSPGPTLRIASSADRLIMGGNGRPLADYAVTQRSNPARVKYVDNIISATPEDAESPKGTPASSSKTPEHKDRSGGSQEKPPVVPNFCRPKISVENLPKRDVSSKELSISRKPVSRAGLGTLFSPSSRSLRSDNEPAVPKIPEKYRASPESGTSQVVTKTAEPATPARNAPGLQDETPGTVAEDSPVPETVVKATSTQLHPPRSSSLQALSGHTAGSESQPVLTPASETPLKVATNVPRNVTFNDILAAADSDKKQIHHVIDKSRLQESKSNHILGSFRNIFKSRGPSIDKSRIRKLDSYTAETVNENQSPRTEQGAKEADSIQVGAEKATKAKNRLPSGVGWNKSSRNPKTADEPPATPSASNPRLLAPPNRVAEGNIPSFARPTKSTTTKATSGLKVHASITTDVNTRRTHVRTASTGSPQRLHRGGRRTASNLLMLSSQKKTNKSPSPASTKTVSAADRVDFSDSTPNVGAVRECLEVLCKKAGEATTPKERERHLRLALSLQQQLGDYQSVEKAAVEAEALAKEKSLAKKVAEESLNMSLSEIQAQLDEE